MTAHKRTGDPVKSLDEALRVGGYLVRFTDDKQRDLHNEYFTKATEFFLETGYPVKGDRILIEHGFDKTFRAMPVGIFEMASVDDVGLWVEGKLNDREDYEEMLRRLARNGKAKLSDDEIKEKAQLAALAVRSIVETGNVQWSSGALPQTVEVDDNGHIKSWAIIEGTMTFTPAEPDGTQIQPIKSALKQLSDLLSNTESSIQTGNPTAAKEAFESEESNGEPDNEERGDGQTHAKTTDNTQPTGIKMDMEKLQSVIDRHLAALMADIASQMGDGDEKMDYDDDDKAAVEADVEARMDDMDDDERKSVTSEQVLGWLADSAVSRFAQKQAATQKAQQKAAQKALEGWKAQQPAQSKAPAYVVGQNGNGQKRTRITVEEEARFADMSAADMALGVKMLMAGIPQPMQKSVKLGDLVSESYARHMAAKAAQELEDRPFRSRSEQMYVKGAMPFKADELNAAAITGQGAEWVTTFFDTQLWERAREQTQLYNLMVEKGMRVRDIPDGADSIRFQTDTSSPTVYLRGEARDLASNSPEITSKITNFGTGNVTATAKEHVAATFITDVLTEDSIIDTVRFANQDMVQVVAEALEDAILNGDTTTTNNINNDGASTTAEPEQELYLAWDGIRHHFLVDNTGLGRDAGGAFSFDDFVNTRQLLPGRIRTRRNRLLYVIDYETEMAALKLPELRTMDVAGNRATVFNGSIGQLDGVDTYVSGFLRLADTDGKVTNGGNATDTGTITCIYPEYWGYARKRSVGIESARGIRGALSGGTLMVVTVRHAFTARSANAAAGSYNVAV